MTIARFLVLLLLVASGPARAGIEAVYVRSLAPSIALSIADNGDFDADIGARRKLVRRGGQVWLVQERLTGPIVDRLEDLENVAMEGRGPGASKATPGISEPPVAPAGPAEVRGRSGEAFAYVRPATERAEKPYLVLSPDPDLGPVAGALQIVWKVEGLSFALANPESDIVPGSGVAAMSRLVRDRAPLRFGDLELKTLRKGAIALAPFDLDRAAESREALSDRIEKERDDEPARGPGVVDAVFADGRLWLATEDGALTSLAPGERRRRKEDAGAPLLALCNGRGGLRALAGVSGKARGWTLRRWAAGRWVVERSIAAEGDSLLAFSCAGPGSILLTDKRIIEAGPEGVTSRGLSGETRGSRVRAVTLETPGHIFLGLNSGEWGGGLIRIDRKSGSAETIERNATGELCAGPLNTACDPVHGIAIIPWKPGCVAAAVGLVHIFGHGRIAEICGDKVEQMFARPSDRHSDAPEAAVGGYGSVPFYGLAAAGGTLLAAGHDGLDRLGPSGVIEHRPWPRFEEVDGLLVSFALPDVVLVITTINSRASLGGAAPILVTR